MLGRGSLFACVLLRGEEESRSEECSKGLSRKKSPRNPGAAEERGAPGARSRAVSCVSDTTLGPGRSPWGGGFRVAMIPPAACIEGGPHRPPLPTTLGDALGPDGSLWSLFSSSFSSKRVILSPHPPLCAGSSAQAQELG